MPAVGNRGGATSGQGGSARALTRAIGASNNARVAASSRRVGWIALALLLIAGAGGGFLRWRAAKARRAGASAGGTAPGAPARARSAGRADAGTHGTPPAAAGRGGSYHTGTTFLLAKWGSNPGELGRKHDQESAPEAPMSAALAPNGDLLVLDQVNGRVARFKPDGTPAGSYPAGGDTNQDIITTPDGRTVVLDRLADKELSIFDADGKLLDTIPVGGGAINDPAGVTGVFSDGSGIYLEREHTEVVRVAGPDGSPDNARPTQPGRPSRDGLYYVWAARAGSPPEAARVRVFNRDAALVWERLAPLPHPILHILLLDTDKLGHLYLGALVAEENPTSHELTDQATVVLRIQLADGADAGMLVLPPNTSPDETFRELIVGDDGTIYQMLPSETGYTVTTYSF
jgi:hypothetical protein